MAWSPFAWLRHLPPARKHFGQGVPRRPAAPTRPKVELLEDRWMPTTVNFGAATYSVGEAAGKLSIDVLLDTPVAAGSSVTVDLVFTDLTATQKADYNLPAS